MRFFAIVLTFFSLLSIAQSPAGVDSEAEQEILRLLNLERARAGLTSVRSDPALQSAARHHSRVMADAHQLSHEFGAEPRFDKRLALAGASFDVSGENVSFNQTAEGAHQGLMNSPPHRKNILDPKFNAVGIGVVRSGNNIWVTEDFAREFEPRTPLEARNQVIAAFQQARRNAHLATVRVSEEPRLQTLTCQMAKQGQLDTRTPLGWFTARSATSYTEPDLSHLPSSALKLATNPTVNHISIGVCFGKDEKYPAGMNWVTIIVY